MATTARERGGGRAGGLVSLFCGAGGLDLGFEEAGFRVAVAVDLRGQSIKSYNHNRTTTVGHVADVRKLAPARLDRLADLWLYPAGIIGGPPCQSFSRAAHSAEDDDRHDLPLEFARILKRFNRRSQVSFFAFENVPGLLKNKHKKRYDNILDTFRQAGFMVRSELLNASSFGIGQDRPRIIVVGYNKELYPGLEWTPPSPDGKALLTVKNVIGGLIEPQYWERGLDLESIPLHPNHWCMVPKSKNFTIPGALVQGTARGRSFRTLDWKQPSPTVAYGNREVHIHPSGRRRLSVYEALLLQGFPKEYVLLGSLSDQISQVSEAVPPPLAKAVAMSIKRDLERYSAHRQNQKAA